jgi:hypothetical protein
MRPFRKWFLVAAAAFLCLGVAIAVVGCVAGVRFFYSARFTEFYVCTGADAVTGLPLPPVVEPPSATEKLYACSFLEADGSAPLLFLLDHEGKGRYFDHGEKYRTGYVLTEIPHRFWQEPGTYRVEVRLNRHKLAEATFTVVP